MNKENLKDKSEYPITNLKKWSVDNTYKFFNIYSEFGSEEFAPLNGYYGYHAYWHINSPILIKNREGITILYENYFK